MDGHIGQQLGNYRLSRLVGKGGFAEVYLGEHVYLKTPAAIKLLQTKVNNPEDLEAFLQEAQTIAQLVHPHIVRVLEFGLDGQTPYLVMDYAPGGTLRQRHPRGSRLPLSTIIPYIKQVTEALQYAHEEKFIHRDVKPENMLVGRRDALLLSDFGIALIAQSSRYQSTQEVIGTVAYMSPEQIQGKPRPASDQYSLAIVVYEWLSGDRPFHGSFTELCTQHMFAPPPPLHEKLPTISPAVEQVVMTALAKDPKQRFGSIQAFANALEEASRVATEEVLLATQLAQPFNVVKVQIPPQQVIEPEAPAHTALPPTVLPIPPEPPPLSSTQLATPMNEISLTPTESVTTSNHTSVPPTQLALSASQAALSSETVASPSQGSSLPTEVALPSKTAVTSSASKIPVQPPQPKRGISRGRAILLVLVALAAVLGSAGLLISAISNSIAMNNAQTTATAQTNATFTRGTANANATVHTINAKQTATVVLATAVVVTATAQAQATASAAQAMYGPATSGSPTLYDPLNDNSKGYNWCVGKCYDGNNGGYCSFTGTTLHIFSSLCPAQNTNFSNFAFEAQITMVPGNYQNYQIPYICGGLFFRADSTIYRYDTFTVCADGTCHLNLYRNQAYFGVSGTCHYNRSGSSQTNLLTVIVRGKTVYAYINNQYFGQDTSILNSGQIGVWADYGVDATLNNAKVWTL